MTLEAVRRRREEAGVEDVAELVMALFTAGFVGAIAVVLLATPLVLEVTRRVGGPVTGTAFYLGPTVGLLVLLALVSWRVAQDPVGQRDLLPLLAWSKVASSAAALALALGASAPGAWIVALTDLPMGGIAAWLYLQLKP